MRLPSVPMYLDALLGAASRFPWRLIIRESGQSDNMRGGVCPDRWLPVGELSGHS